MNKKVILEYVHTILVSLLVALTLAGIATGCSKVIGEHHARMLSRIANTAKDNELILELIDKYTEMSKEDTADYSINVRLGNLYELMFAYDQAEKQYKKAINKSPYGVYSSYMGLANLYVKQNKHKKALTIVKQLKNTDHKPLLVAKGDFYMNLGDALWQKNKYQEALNQYKVAFFYYKKVDSNKKDLTVTGILDCYDKIADDHFKHNRIDKAIESLETALLYKETPILYYKLAILYKGFNPLASNDFMEKTYAIDPGLINYDLYEEILIDIIRYYYENGDDLHTELYKQKLKSIRNFQKRYVITETDAAIDIVKLKVKNNLFRTQQTIDLKYKIENNSKYDFNTLYFVVKLRYDNTSKTILKQKLYTKEKPLKSRTVSDVYELQYEYSTKDDIFLAKNVWMDFYVSKKENMRKIPIYSIEIKR